MYYSARRPVIYQSQKDCCVFTSSTLHSLEGRATRSPVKWQNLSKVRGGSRDFMDLKKTRQKLSSIQTDFLR